MSMDLIDQFLQWKQFNQGRSVGTCTKYRLYLQRLYDYLDGNLIQAEREQLESFVGIKAHKDGMSPRSRRAMVAAIKGFYTWLHRERIIPSNPSISMEYPNAGSKLPVAASLQTAEALLMAPDLETFKGVRDAAILALLIGGGLRVSGLCRLNESSLLWVRDDNGAERLILKVVEKGKKERLLPVSIEAKLLLRAYLGHHELKQIDRTIAGGDRVLFVSLRNRLIPEYDYYGENRRITAKAIHGMIQHYGKKLRLPADQLHPHALRHLYGAELAESDMDLIKSQALLGHADPKTSAIYMKLAIRKLSRVVDIANPLSKIKTPVTDIIKSLEAK